jgi:integrase
MTNTSAYLIWGEIAKRSPAPRRVEIPKLQKYLSSLDNPHACVLTDRIPTAHCDQESALTLEAWVISQFQKSPNSLKLSKLQLADWLRLIFDAVRQFNQRGQVMWPTRLADVMRPQSSPFSVPALDAQRRVDPWRKALYQWIDKENSQKTYSEWLAAIALSAIFHGALIDSTKLKMFVAKLVQKDAPVYENDCCYVLFHLPYQGLGNHNMHRWFLDPLTEMLTWQFLKLEFPAHAIDLKATALIKDFLTPRIQAKSFRPKSLFDLLKSSTVWWSQRASPIDLHCALRTLSSHAINKRSWARLNQLPFATGPSKERVARISRRVTDNDTAFEDTVLLHPWLQEAIEILNKNIEADIKPAINTLIKQEHDNPIASLYLDWLFKMLCGLSSSKEPLATSTVRRRFVQTAPRLIGLISDDSPLEMSTLELEDYYSEIIINLDRLTPLTCIANGLRDFHAYMHKIHKKPLMKKEDDVLGDENSLKPVDANILSFDEYALIQAWLDKQRVPKQDIHAAKIVLMMAFKLGLRRMEIFGLLRRDIQLSRYPSCLVRKNDLRRLKTDNSKRIIPLLAFLNKAERCLLLSWIHSSELENNTLDENNIDTDYLFPEFDGAESEAWIYRVATLTVTAIRTVTGDGSLFLHHLRHAFGTWTYLRLRAPDFPHIKKHFEHLPATLFALNTGMRLRILLFGRNPGISRTYPFAVSRLLGHSSPVVSFGHYVHSSDLVMAAIARRECDRLPDGVLLAASGLKKSAAYSHLGVSIDSLLTTSRSIHLPSEVKKPPSPEVKPRKGRPPLPAAHENPNWIALALVEQVITLSIVHHVSNQEISATTGIELHRVTTILEKATAFGKSIGISCDETGQLTDVPLKTHRKFGTEYCGLMEIRLADLSSRMNTLYTKGIQAYLDHYDQDKKDVVFQGVKDLEQARLVMKFLEGLGADKSEFCYVTRDIDTTRNKLPKWAHKLVTKWRPLHFKCIRPKNATGAKYYREWVGILPVDSTKRSLGLPVAKTIFLASLVANVTPSISGSITEVSEP